VAAQTGSRSGAQPLSSLHAAVRPRSHGDGGGGDAAAPCQTASDAPAGTQRLKDVRHTAAWGERAVRLRRAIGVTPSRAHTPTLLPHMVQVPPGTPRLHAGGGDPRRLLQRIARWHMRICVNS
jgi:hypothetical protein